MPLSIDVILNNKVLGPAFLKKVEEESKAARAAALVEGRMEGELSLLRWMLESRFGDLPAAVEERLHACKEAELKDIAQRAMSAGTLEELFPNN